MFKIPPGVAHINARGCSTEVLKNLKSTRISFCRRCCNLFSLLRGIRSGNWLFFLLSNQDDVRLYRFHPAEQILNDQGSKGVKMDDLMLLCQFRKRNYLKANIFAQSRTQISFHTLCRSRQFGGKLTTHNSMSRTDHYNVGFRMITKME